jgi:aryl-alcohol dehydrogenase-like predicted oxidoreductase
MQYRQLGRTDMHVSQVCMGCWTIVGDRNWGPTDEADAIATIEAALDVGINFFDTAEGYGAGVSEELLARGLGGRRADVIIADKVSVENLAPADLRAACERSLQRLNTDHIDLYQIHWPSREVPLADSLGEMNKLLDEGKIRAIGVSNFGVNDMSDLLDIQPVQSNQLPYNLLWRAIEFQLRDICVDRDVSILCYSALMQGLLSGKFKSADEVPAGRARTKHFSDSREHTRHGREGHEELTFQTLAKIEKIAADAEIEMPVLALGWLLHQDGVTSVIAGARTPDQIRTNAVAGDIRVPGDVLYALTEATDELKEAMGDDPDMWADESRFR